MKAPCQFRGILPAILGEKVGAVWCPCHPTPCSDQPLARCPFPKHTSHTAFQSIVPPPLQLHTSFLPAIFRCGVTHYTPQLSNSNLTPHQAQGRAEKPCQQAQGSSILHTAPLKQTAASCLQHTSSASSAHAVLRISFALDCLRSCKNSFDFDQTPLLHTLTVNDDDP